MSTVPAVALAVMAATDVVTVLLVVALGLAALRLARHVRAVMKGLTPETQPIASEIRVLTQRLRATASVAQEGAQHARASASDLGAAAGNVRALVAPPALPRFGLIAGAKTGARFARKWYLKRRTT